ncbi:MAG: hypothetical protein KAV87_58185 [Desulfobacteraceae bacterium]|nr:hypothetical protein [Desulfobacteraceae bacterium]
MNRKAIKNYTRFLFQELSESPEGIIKDDDTTEETDLNNLVNISLATVELDLIPIIPREFRSSFLISLVKDKQSYDLVDDLGVDDFLSMEDIFHNETAKKPEGLLYVTHDQIPDFRILVGESSFPKLWAWESKDVIGFYGTPKAAAADIFKAFYFKMIPELLYDDVDIDDEGAAGNGSTKVFSFTSSKIPVITSSVTISYTVGSTDYTGTDDGAGVITGTGLTGTIDYTTGAIALTFTTAPDNDTTIDLAATATNKHVVPAFPVVSHHLIGIDVALQLMVADEGGARNVSALYGRELSRIGGRLRGLKPSLRTDRRSKLSKLVR